MDQWQEEHRWRITVLKTMTLLFGIQIILKGTLKGIKRQLYTLQSLKSIFYSTIPTENCGVYSGTNDYQWCWIQTASMLSLLVGYRVGHIHWSSLIALGSQMLFWIVRFFFTKKNPTDISAYWMLLCLEVFMCMHMCLCAYWFAHAFVESRSQWHVSSSITFPLTFDMEFLSGTHHLA